MPLMVTLLLIVLPVSLLAEPLLVVLAVLPAPAGAVLPPPVLPRVLPPLAGC